MLPEELPQPPAGELELTPQTEVETSTAPTVETTPREPFWGYTDLALVVGLLAAFTSVMLVIVGFLVARRSGFKGDEIPFLFITQFALYGFVYLSFWLVLRARYGKPVFESLGWRRCNFHFLIAAVGGVALAFLVSAFASLIHTPKVPTPIDKLAETPWSLAILGLIAATAAPLFEELFFRGFLQPLLSRTFGVAAGILLTAALFGGMHAPEYAWAWQYVVAVGLVGAVFGWLRARTNSIIPSTIMHGCYNIVFVVALAVTKHT